MRCHYIAPDFYGTLYGKLYVCNHPLYDRCTLYQIENKGLAVIQQKFHNKITWWEEIDAWLIDSIYLNKYFYLYFQQHSREADENGLYPTVTARQIMWTLKMKPTPKEA